MHASIYMHYTHACKRICARTAAHTVHVAHASMYMHYTYACKLICAAAAMSKRQKTEAFRCNICDEMQDGSSKIWASNCRWCWIEACWKCIDEEFTCSLCDIGWRLERTHITIEGAMAADRSNNTFKMRWDNKSREEARAGDWRTQIDLAWSRANKLRTLEKHNDSDAMMGSR